MNPKDHLLAHERLRSYGWTHRTKPTNAPRTAEQQATDMVTAAQRQARRQLKRLRDVERGGFDTRRKASAR